MLTDVGAGRGALGSAGGRDAAGGAGARAGGSSPQSSSSGAFLGGAVFIGAGTGAPNTGRGAGGTRRMAAMSGLPMGV